MIDSQPRFIQGIISFVGAGYQTMVPLAPATYTVAADKRAQLLYVRAGNSSAEMIVLALMRDDRLMRYLPLGAKASMHVQLTVVEDLTPETRLELMVLAPEGLRGTVAIDLGLVEI